MLKPSNEEGVAGRVAVITGGGGELGRALAHGFAGHAARVALFDIEPAFRRAQALARRLGPQALAVRCDITREADVRQAFTKLLHRWGRIDFLINNASIEGPTAPVEKIRRQDWERTLAVNLTAAFLCTREAALWTECSRGGPAHRLAPSLACPERSRRVEGSLGEGGCIIQIGSVAGRIAYPLRLPYAVSKWALASLTATLAAELGPYNIRVNLVAPGPILGERMRRVIRRRARATGQSQRAVRESYLKATALGRMVEPEDVVRLVLFLCSAAGKNITGQTLEVSAGWTAGSL